MNPRTRVEKALEVAFQHGGTDGAHHKAWVIDQMVRELTGCPTEHVVVPKVCEVPGYEYDRLGESIEYRAWVVERKNGEDGPETYDWDEGIPPEGMPPNFY